MKTLFLFLSIILCGHFSNAANENLLNRLDSMVANRHDYETARKEAITARRMELDEASDDGSRYGVLRGLYENYRSYMVDSALIVAKERLDIARKMGEPSKIASGTLNVAEAYVKSGSPYIAIAILDTLDRSSLADYHHKYLNSIYLNAYEMIESIAVTTTDRMEARGNMTLLRDKAQSESTPDSRGYYTLEAERLADAGFYDEAIAKMLEAEARFDFEDDAAMQYAMGEIYLRAGQRENAIERLTKSAMLDISSSTKEYKSLILLASLLFEEGQIARAFDYINCAFEDAQFSKANLRTAEIMKIMPHITTGYYAAEKEVADRTRNFLIISGILMVLLLVLLAVAIRQIQQKRQLIREIERINAELIEKNGLLANADALKLQNINILMMANAKHINSLREFRRKIYRLLMAAQYEKAAEAVKLDKTDAADIATIHALFDEAFLSMFPDFVDNINKYMKEPVSIKGKNQLTPELRVVAMMYLGMTSTDEIARMFHYSPQTVYNLRTSIRNMLNISWAEFETYLKKL